MAGKTHHGGESVAAEGEGVAAEGEGVAAKAWGWHLLSGQQLGRRQLKSGAQL